VVTILFLAYQALTFKRLSVNIDGASAVTLGCNFCNRGFHPVIQKSDNRQMALLPILSYPDPRLHTVAKPVAVVDDRIRTLAADMIETMYDAKGVGLAATQVNVHERLLVMDVSEDRNQPMVLINPELLWASQERVKNEEGCLSVPGIFDGVERPERVKVQALNEHGESFTLEADGLMAICVQHEMDHLMGKVFVEYLSTLKRMRIKSKLLKAQRDAER
jgi:peptide deformylase